MSDSKTNHSKRQSLRNKLTLNWVKRHRPDVVRAIEIEIEKSCPNRVRTVKALALPESLEVLK